MASNAKKNKARNSYIHNGGMKSKKICHKLKKGFKGNKRIDYYTASDRQQLNKLEVE